MTLRLAVYPPREHPPPPTSIRAALKLIRTAETSVTAKFRAEFARRTMSGIEIDLGAALPSFSAPPPAAPSSEAGAALAAAAEAPAAAGSATKQDDGAAALLAQMSELTVEDGALRSECALPPAPARLRHTPTHTHTHRRSPLPLHSPLADSFSTRRSQ